MLRDLRIGNPMLLENLGWANLSIDRGEFLREELSKIKAVRYQDIGIEKCGVVTFNAESQEHRVLKDKFTKNGINVSISTKTLTLIDKEVRNLESLIRASVHYYNTEEELLKFSSMLKSLI